MNILIGLLESAGDKHLVSGIVICPKIGLNTGTKFSWDSLTDLIPLELECPSEAKSKQLFGVLVFADGTWMERVWSEENGGKSWWELRRF